MSQKTLRIIHLCYGIALSALLLATAGLFIASCIGIYQSGSRPFSRESIAVAFQSISLPVYLTIAAVVGGSLLSLFLPIERKKPKADRNDYDVLRRLKDKVGERIPTNEPQIRLYLRIGTAVISVLLGIYPASLFFDLSRFTLTDINGSVIASVFPALLWAAIVITLSTICSLLCTASTRRECDAYKRALVDGRSAPPSASDVKHDARAAVQRTSLIPRKTSRGLLAIRLVLLLTALTFIVLGVLNGGSADVLGKAIRICTECIGLG